MIDVEILQALQTAANEAIASTTEQPLPILALGRTKVEPPTDTMPEKYFEYVHISNNINGQYLGNERVFQGIFRVLLHWPLDDAGAYAPLGLIGLVGAYFPKEKRFINGAANVQIYSEPDIGSSFRSGAELIFPLTLRYRCFRP